MRLLPDPLWGGYKGALFVLGVGMSRLDRLFDSLNEPKDSTNGLRGKVCGAGQLLRVKREAFRIFSLYWI